MSMIIAKISYTRIFYMFCIEDVPLQHSKCKAAPATSFAGDIENVSCVAPAYRKCSSSFQIICGGKYLISIAQYRFLFITLNLKILAIQKMF